MLKFVACPNVYIYICRDVKNLSLKVVRKIEISFVNKFWAVERLARPKVKKWAEPS